MNKQKVEWKQVKGYNGLYSISNTGIVKRNAGYQAKKDRTIKPRLKNSGYLYVTLSQDNQKKNHYVHHLVAQHFVGKRPNGYDINHKDGDKVNNCAFNLEYMTRAENMAHARKNGLHNNRGDGHYNAKLNSELVAEIRFAHNACGVFDEIVETLPVSRGAIRDVLTYRTWKDVRDE